MLATYRVGAPSGRSCVPVPCRATGETPGCASAAEPDLTRDTAADLHVGDRSRGDDDLAAAGVDEGEGAVVGQRLLQAPFDLLGRLGGVDDQLARGVLDSDLD